MLLWKQASWWRGCLVLLHPCCRHPCLLRQAEIRAERQYENGQGTAVLARLSPRRVRACVLQEAELCISCMLCNARPRDMGTLILKTL